MKHGAPLNGATPNRWLSQLPRAAVVAIAVLIVAELVRMGLLLPSLARVADSPPSASQVPRREEIDIHKIVAAHLFGAANEEATAQPGTARPAAANLALTGTIATKNPMRGAAIISNDGKSAMYATGSTLDGASIFSVYVDRVILKRGEQLEVLHLPRSDAAAAEHASARADGEAPGNSTSEPADSGPGLSEVMRVGAAVSNETGKVRGFHIFPGKDRAAFASAGLRPGDLVVAVNGANVIEQDRPDAFSPIVHSPRATLTIERFGRVTDVTIDAEQAGGTATSVQ